MAHYLVTGGCGFIGSHLVDVLIAAGHHVTVLDNLSTGSLENLNGHASMVRGDINDRDLVADLLGAVDGCFHLAAVASVALSNEDWVGCHQANLTGTINVFEGAQQRLGRRAIPVVFASSAAAYGDNAGMPLSELSTPQPITAYGADKLACELHGRVAWLVHKIPNTGLRFFNVFGPRQHPSSSYSGVISIFMSRLLAGQPITILGDGRQSRDFVYVGDVVEHLLAAMNGLQRGHQVFNVCTGRMTTINQLASTMANITGRTPSMTYKPTRLGDIRLSLGDPSRAIRHLGVRAKTTMAQGLQQMVRAQSVDHISSGERIESLLK